MHTKTSQDTQERLPPERELSGQGLWKELRRKFPLKFCTIEIHDFVKSDLNFKKLLQKQKYELRPL